MIYRENVEEIHSFDAKYKNVIFRNNNLIVPYLNLGVSNHPLHIEKRGMTYIDFSYMVFEGISFLRVFITKPYIVIELKNQVNHLYFGGDYLDYESKIYNDMEIGCSDASLHILEVTKFSKKMWTLSDTQDFKRNTDSKFVMDFFDHKFIPEKIRQLVE